MSSAPFVSIIIPVFNDGKRLRLCLNALAGQTYGRPHIHTTDDPSVDDSFTRYQKPYEVIVIDNASDPGQNISKIVASFSFATYLYEPKPGSYAARNSGIMNAKGTIIAFTDADCIPRADWLEKGVYHLTRVPNCGLVAGRIDLFFRKEGQPSPVELYESITAFPQERQLKEQRGAATGNVFTFKAVMEQVGLFNDRLRSSGDLEWGERVYKAGFQQFYARDVCVAHPARYTFKELHRRTLRIAGGVFGRFIQPQHSSLQRNMTFARLIADDLTPPVRFTINAFRDKRLSGFRQKLMVSLVLVWVRYVSVIEKIRLKLGGVPARE